MKLRHLLHVVFLLVLALSLPFLTLLLSRGRAPSSQYANDAGDALLRRLAAIDAGRDHILADAATLLANATISSFPSHNNLPCSSAYIGSGNATSSCHRDRRTVSSLHVPNDMMPDDGVLLAAFRASLHSFLREHQNINNNNSNNNSSSSSSSSNVLSGLLGRRFHTCAVVGNSGILLGSGRGAQIDAHDVVIRLNNAPVVGFVSDVGARTSLTVTHSGVFRLCSEPSAAAATPGCACHPYGRSVPLAMYVSHPMDLLDVVACAATATAASIPFLLRLTDARLDALSARIAKYYSLRRFVAATGEPASGWTRRHDGIIRPHFHYSSGLQAVLMALGACEEVSMFGFGKSTAAKHHYHTDQKRETDVHDYEAEYEFYRDLQTWPEAVPFLDEATGFKVPTVTQYW
ncbi:hypothetical protein HU200_066237 [Digitaria exilis]|uniref:Uncharacterized protein n=1 Tax=Digitaria exilis TaxID=1010633 RepID=A0A835DWT1_9POAL|nr:hypothetical protein HU200_066237 [Digitaria exilis]